MKVFVLTLILISVLLIVIPFIAAIRKLNRSKLGFNKKFTWGLIILFLPFFGSIFYLSHDD